jgi:hypothetical protein
MGSGKGSPEYWVAVVKPGRVMFEIAGVSEETAREAMRLAMHKLPIKCKFVKKEGAVAVAETDDEVASAAVNEVAGAAVNEAASVAAEEVAE